MVRCNTSDVFSTTDKTSDTDITQQWNEKGHKGNNKPNSSLQQPAPLLNETDINTFCSCQQLAPEVTTDTTSLNTTTEISPTDWLKHALANLQKKENDYANTDQLQQNIRPLESKLKSKDRII